MLTTYLECQQRGIQPQQDHALLRYVNIPHETCGYRQKPEYFEGCEWRYKVIPISHEAFWSTLLGDLGGDTANAIMRAEHAAHLLRLRGDSRRASRRPVSLPESVEDTRFT